MQTELTEKQIVILRAAKAELSGELLLVHWLEDRWAMQAKNVNLICDQTPRAIAEWHEALSSLEAQGLLVQLAYSGGGNDKRYRLTVAGHDAAARL